MLAVCGTAWTALCMTDASGSKHMEHKHCIYKEPSGASAAPSAKVPRVLGHVSVQRRQGSLRSGQRRARFLLHLRGPWGCGQRQRGRAGVPVVQQDAWPQAQSFSRVQGPRRALARRPAPVPDHWVHAVPWDAWGPA